MVPAVFLSVLRYVFLTVCTSCGWLYVGMYFGLCASVCSDVYVQCDLLASRCVWPSVFCSVAYCVCTPRPPPSVHPSLLSAPGRDNSGPDPLGHLGQLDTGKPPTFARASLVIASPRSPDALDTLAARSEPTQPRSLPTHPKARLSTNVLPARRPPQKLAWLRQALP